MTIDQIEKEFDYGINSDNFEKGEYRRIIECDGLLLYEDRYPESEYELDENKIKSFYRAKITELLEELAKEAIGVEGKNSPDDDTQTFFHITGWNFHRQQVISAFERRGIKI